MHIVHCGQHQHVYKFRRQVFLLCSPIIVPKVSLFER